MKDFFKRIVVAVLTFEAKLLLRRHKPKIIAITGSVGKTATKDAVYTVIKQSFSVRKSEKSFNSELGVPLTVLGLPNAWNNPYVWIYNCLAGFLVAMFSRNYPQILVLETGVDTPGDMKKLTSWLKPDYVIVTRLPNVPVHVEFFSSPEAVVQEKMTLVHALPVDGTLIYNADDEILTRECTSLSYNKVTYARYREATYQIRNDQTKYYDDEPVGYTFNFCTKNEEYDVLVNGVIGMPLGYVYSAALSVADQLAIPLAEAVARLNTHVPPPGRMRIIAGIKGTIIIDDTYNSSPVAAESALQTLRELKYAKRKIAVLGDMFELGTYSVAEHERIGEFAAEASDMLIAVGVRSRSTAKSVLANGMSEKHVLQYDDMQRAGSELQNILENGDVILVKASQGMRGERLVEEIMEEPEKAPDLLVRQDKEWKQR